ncbi:MAG: cytochrome c [Alphaproteobacteria bacterium]
MMRAFAAAFGAILIAGCDQQMEDMPRSEPLEASPVFRDGMSARLPVPGTVARDDDIGPQRTSLPDRPGMAYLEQGQKHYNIFCVPCHDMSGTGKGIVVQRGFPEPPSFHLAALRMAPDVHFYNVITAGYGAMHPYADRVPPEDRWAIVAYIRTLQLAHHAPLDMLPDALRRQLDQGAGR